MRISFKQSRKLRPLAGVTLIEAMVAMAVFGVSFFSLYAGISMGFSIIGSARENLRATQIMVEKMETIRLYSWDQINTSGFVPTTFSESYDPSGGGGQEQGNVGLTYFGRVTIGSGPSGHSYSGDMRQVTINLGWTSGGRPHARTMTTYVSRYGLQNYIY
jgi:hypothetical protein